MIPPPVDPALLREHAFADTGNLAIVLNPEKVGNVGGYKPVTEYGLGYFNYVIASNKCVRGISYREIIRGHFYHYFMLYFISFLIMFGIWVLLLLVREGHVAKLLHIVKSKVKLRRKKKDDISYDYVPV